MMMQVALYLSGITPFHSNHWCSAVCAKIQIVQLFQVTTPLSFDECIGDDYNIFQELSPSRNPTITHIHDYVPTDAC